MKLVLDGNIGCGKSSIIDKISCTKIPYYNEPLEDWSKWLELFYSDMSKYSFGFQMRVLKSHFDKKKIDNGIFERSPLSCQHIFGQILYEDKMMTEIEWNLTNEFNNEYGWVPDVIIYLKCDPKICHKRINQRNRSGEESISLEYLSRLHDKYEKLYLNNDSIKVFTIDAEQNIDDVFNDIKKLNLFQLN